MKASGKIEIVTLSDKEADAWRNALRPVQKEVAPRVGGELIDAIQKEAAALGYK
jgi:C4-dicarboxylate-binding protein DctP